MRERPQWKSLSIKRVKVIPRGRTHTNSKGAMLCHSSPRFSEKEVKTVRANRTKTNSYQMIPIWICFLQCVRSDSAVFFFTWDRIRFCCGYSLHRVRSDLRFNKGRRISGMFWWLRIKAFIWSTTCNYHYYLLNIYSSLLSLYPDSSNSPLPLFLLQF